MCNKAGNNTSFHGDNITFTSRNQYVCRSSFENVSFSKGVTLLIHGDFLSEWSMLVLGLDLQHTGVYHAALMVFWKLTLSGYWSASKKKF